MNKLMLWLMVISMIIAPLRVSVASDDPHCAMSGMSDHVATVATNSDIVAIQPAKPMSVDNYAHTCCDTDTSCSITCVMDCATGSTVSVMSIANVIESRFEHVLTVLNVRNQPISREPTPPARPPADLPV